MTTYILAIDPGKLMGVAHLKVPTDEPARCVYSCETDGTPALVELVFTTWLAMTRRCWDCTDKLVVIEDWEYRPGVPTDARWACEPIGAFAYLCWKNGIKMVRQKPAYRRSIPDTLKQWESKGLDDYYQSGGKGHKRQALRHGMAHVVHKMHHVPTMEMLNPRS